MSTVNHTNVRARQTGKFCASETSQQASLHKDTCQKDMTKTKTKFV